MAHPQDACHGSICLLAQIQDTYLTLLLRFYKWRFHGGPGRGSSSPRSLGLPVQQESLTWNPNGYPHERGRPRLQLKLKFRRQRTIFLVDASAGRCESQATDVALEQASGEGRVKLLIAEDEPLFRKLLVQLLSPEFEVTITEDGTTALARLQEEDAPVLAILDWVMPGLTGIEVCRELRAHRRTAGIYVILLTVRNSAADIVAGLRAGADDYVTKPVQKEELRARVQLGCRIIELRAALKTEVGALAVALAREKLLLSRLASVPQRAPRRESKKAVLSPA
jgi:CheY-like chemotaxis protein